MQKYMKATTIKKKLKEKKISNYLLHKMPKAEKQNEKSILE